ncbi:MAG: hypothetical protein AB1941_27390 [Gemmatimonadota bacterium]
MIVRNLTDQTPAGVHIATGRYAYSRSGAAMATSGLMGCMGVVVHDPATRRGCLGHVEPERHMSTFLARCIHLMGTADAQCRNLEVVFVGGNRGATFAVDVATDLNDNWLSAMNCYDGRRGAAAPFVGERILEALNITYHPHAGAVYVGANPLVVPPYADAVTQEVLTVGLNMRMVTCAALA